LLVFTNVLKKSSIERLAQVDENEVVQDVQVCCVREAEHPIKRIPQEIFADYCPLTTSHVSLNVLPSPLAPETQSLYGLLFRKREANA
jgi:vacuolar protein sorting-associated protein 45